MVIDPAATAWLLASTALVLLMTLPGLGQSLVLTRTPGRASAMPPGETLVAFGATGATLAIHLSIHNLAQVVADLTPLYGPDCPAAIIWRASWPDQRIVRGMLASIEALAAGGPERTAIILVGSVLGESDFAESQLYAPGYDRRFRPATADSPFAGSDE